ncbi:MAG: DNA polymerase III subunit delta' [Helicobacteraceae bacterium]|nr:DNA polymerase III subunit delta' [Helicobacteraceae bacterium]
MNNRLGSHIIICDNIEERSTLLQHELSAHRVVSFVREDFKIEDSKAVMAEAYIAEEHVKYLILAAKTFNQISQNALLKLLEEPPRNIELIVITESKSTLLPTVRSRLKIIKEQSAVVHRELDIKLSNLNLSTLFDFVKAHERLSKHEAKTLIESLYRRATVVDRLSLTEKQIEIFEHSYRLVELNGRLQTILVALLMTFLPKAKRGS